MNLPPSRPNSGHGRSVRQSGGPFAAAAGAALFLGLGIAGAAVAQTAPAQPPRDLSTVPPSTLIDPQAEKEADKIKSQTWRSAPVGQKGNWNLDIGTFKEDKSLEQDLRERIDENVESYSGMRLRLPLKGGQ